MADSQHLPPAAADAPQALCLPHKKSPSRLRFFVIESLRRAGTCAMGHQFNDAREHLTNALMYPQFGGEVALHIRMADVWQQENHYDHAGWHVSMALDALDANIPQYAEPNHRTVNQLATLAFAFVHEGDGETAGDVLVLADRLGLHHDRLDEAEYRVECHENGRRPLPWAQAKPTRFTRA